MNITRNDLWATPVWEVDTGFDGKFNAALMREINLIHSSPGNEFNIWEYNTPCVSELRQKITDLVDEIVSPEIPSYIKKKLSLTRGWVNYHKTGESLATHSHGSTVVACSYYLKVPLNSGDLMLYDPRGGVNWGWEIEGGIVGVKHTRIKPKEGSLVIFPGFLLHSVETNRSPIPRVSLASNLILA